MQTPRLHCVTDDRVLSQGDWQSAARSVAEGWGEQVAIHIRSRERTGRELFQMTRQLLEVAEHTGTAIYVNDRVDVALAAGATGVQLGGRSIEASDARAVLGDAADVGVSCHLGDDLSDRTRGADFAILGHVYQTPTHAGVPPIGLEAVTVAVDAAPVPVVAIGGIDASRVAPVLSAGAHGVAIVRGVWDAPDPREAAGEILSAIEDVVDGQ